jgi:hypothetical protein
MKSFSMDDWRSAPRNAGESLPVLAKQDATQTINPFAAEPTQTHGQHARLCWHLSKQHFGPAIFYLAAAIRHGALHFIQLSIAFLRRHLWGKAGLLKRWPGLGKRKTLPKSEHGS